MLKKIVLSIATLSVLSMTACQDTGPKQTVGTLGGAALGGLAGAQFGKGTGQLVGVGVGALLGGLVGSEVGRSLDNADRAAANRATTQSLNSGRVGDSIRWNNPNSGNSGTVRTTRDGYDNDGRYCREYQHNVVVGGKTQQAYGNACRQPDGSWQVSN